MFFLLVLGSNFIQYKNENNCEAQREANSFAFYKIKESKNSLMALHTYSFWFER